MEDGGSVKAGGGRGLDQDVRPFRIVGIVGKADLLGEAERGQREISLRVGRDRVEVDAEGGRAERLDPVRLRACQVIARVEALSQLDQARPESTFVERGAPAIGDRA